ncbi:unnamed protein product, partial [Lampetra planeri]
RAARDGAVVTERCARVAVRASLQGQRTVYRLTLVKAWNVEEVTAYANLVALGNPDFIEVKVSSAFSRGSAGVTYCGESSASSLTMANVPWHEEVVGFVQQLAAMLPDYELACEHEHSNCLLLAHKRCERHRRVGSLLKGSAGKAAIVAQLLGRASLAV